ncbi:MAG TPA: hypothetical protein VNP72_04195 [Longimicrobium sp.]|nr:hypothetical protein [Longimicrobium sp.]
MTGNHRGWTLPALLLLAGAAGCGIATADAAQRVSRADLLTDRPPPPDRRIPCTVMREPAVLPAADALVDVAALSADAAALWAQKGQPSGYVLLGLRQDPAGINVRREVLEHTLTEELADTLQELVFAYRRTTAPADQEWGVRLRLDLGVEPAVRVGRSELCPPYREEDRWIADPSRATPYFSPSAQDPWNVDARVRVRVAVNERGRVVTASIERGMVRADVGLLEGVRNLLFYPAEQDGHPVAGETTILLFRPAPLRRTVR